MIKALRSGKGKSFALTCILCTNVLQLSSLLWLIIALLFVNLKLNTMPCLLRQLFIITKVLVMTWEQVVVSILEYLPLLFLMLVSDLFKCVISRWFWYSSFFWELNSILNWFVLCHSSFLLFVVIFTMRLFKTDDLFTYANYDLDAWTNTVCLSTMLLSSSLIWISI